jgi:hypothetical protein
MINENDKSDYLFLSENTTYGNTIQTAITYHKELLKILNTWIYNLNKSIIKDFEPTSLIKKYIFEYKMYSDIFYLDRSKQQVLTLYNTKLLSDILPMLNESEKKKILKNCEKNIELLTYDLLALLNVFKHFTEDPDAINYVKKQGTNFDNKKYVFTEYLNKCNIWLTNYYKTKDLLNNKY